jgi:hypothetical protein
VLPSAATDTTSVTVPTSSLNDPRSSCPLAFRTLLRRSVVRNPASSTRTVYDPASTARKANSPRSPETVVRALEVDSLVSVTVAPGTT